MEIIRHGMFATEKQKFFECVVCKCMFKVDSSDVDDIQDYEKGYAICPECGMLAFEISSENVKNYIKTIDMKVDD